MKIRPAKILILLFLSVLGTPLQAQVNFENVDEHARSIRKANTYQKTAERLVAPFDRDIDRARAIFIWITDHISYDIDRAVNYSGSKAIRIVADSEEELALIRKKREEEKALKGFRTGKGVCENYAFLFYFMAEHVGLEASFIAGHGRNNPRMIGRGLYGAKHAWNGVRIDGRWYLLDATWAAGMADTQKGTFRKNYQQGFFMTDPAFFVTTHLPDDPNWQLLDEAVSEKEFTAMPIGHHALGSSGITDYFPKRGTIKAKGTIQLAIKLEDTSLPLILLDNRRITKIKPHIKGDEVHFRINGKGLKGHELSIAKKEDGKVLPILSYLVI